VIRAGTLIRAARPEELSTLQDIEVAAGAMFLKMGMDAVAEDPPPELSDLATWPRIVMEMPAAPPAS
jgi:hypothetical protein